MSEPILTVKDLGVAFNGNTVLSDVSFTLDRGETIALVGPNGAGKSVLLRAILDLVPHSGTVVWAPDIKVAYIPQLLSASRDLPLTVKELFNLRHIDKDVMQQDLEHVEMANRDVLDMPIGQLSGGQFQRIMIAWAAAQRPDVLLFDEPAGGIDRAGKTSAYELIEHLQEKHHISIILVSHDLSVVYRYAKHVICINQTMTCHGAPQETLTPETLQRLYGPLGGAFDHHFQHQHHD